jgi:Fur family ferric uptake transcriptional regulator
MEEKKTKHLYQDEILKICRKQHLTADDVLKKIRKKYPQVGQATVYRTINFLTENNLLNRISLNNKSYYETQEIFHGHLIMKGEIKDFEISEKVLKEVEKKIGKKIKALDLKVFI